MIVNEDDLNHSLYAYSASYVEDEMSTFYFTNPRDAVANLINNFCKDNSREIYLWRIKAKNLKLSDYINIDKMLDEAEIDCDDTTQELNNHEEYFNITLEQKNNLKACIANAIDHWQAKHKLVFRSQKPVEETFFKIPLDKLEQSLNEIEELANSNQN